MAWLAPALRPLSLARAPHLPAALLALLVLALALAGGVAYARLVERRAIRAVAPLPLSQKMQGRALQAEAFRQSDLLPLYGASELQHGGSANPSLLFQHGPTGFLVFPIGHPGSTALNYVQALAAVGSTARGKKVAFTFTPDEFFHTARQDAYDGSYSRLHAYALAFSPDLSFELKREVAARMLDYPRTAPKDPLLAFALRQLIAGSPLNRALYLAAVPLGRLATMVFCLQDHWATLTALAALGPVSAAPAAPARLDWPALLAAADQTARAQATNNPFGFKNEFWDMFKQDARRFHNEQSDQDLQRLLDRSPGRTDLELLLRTVRELGAQPLVLVAPLPGAFSDYTGVTPQGRAGYYAQIEAIARRYNVPLLDFADHDLDRFFVEDRVSHPSPKGWMFFDQALDAFVHGALP